MSFRIDFKIVLFTFKALHGLAPSYITDMLERYEPGRTLRSANKALLTVQDTNRVTVGDRAFSARAPILWNALPLGLRLIDSLGSFKSQLKTYLYTKAFL